MKKTLTVCLAFLAAFAVVGAAQVTITTIAPASNMIDLDPGEMQNAIFVVNIPGGTPPGGSVNVSLVFSGAIAPFFVNLLPGVQPNVVIPAGPGGNATAVFEGMMLGQPCNPQQQVFTGTVQATINGMPTGQMVMFTITQVNCTPPSCIPPTPAIELGSQPLTVFTGTNLDFDVVAQANTMMMPSVTISGVSVEAAAFGPGGVCGNYFNAMLPANVSHNPPLPVTGQPATTSVSWTPTNAQVGCWRFTYHLVDNMGFTSDCVIEIKVVECMMLVGVQPVSIPVGANDILRVMPLIVHPVTMSSIPSIQIPNHPGLNDFRVYTQVMMFNPDVFPVDSLRMSQGLEYVIGQGSSTYGTASGMYIYPTQPVVHPGGSLLIGFGIN